MNASVTRTEPETTRQTPQRPVTTSEGRNNNQDVEDSVDASEKKTLVYIKS